MKADSNVIPINSEKRQKQDVNNESPPAELLNSSEVLAYWPAQVDNHWQEIMVLQYAPLIKYIASRLALRLPSHISLDDLISSGIIGLIDAIHKFDPRKNIAFKTYAEFRIKGTILDELRALDWIPRSVRKKTHLLENAYAELQKTLGRPAELEEVAEALGLNMDEFFQLLDETKSVSLVELEGVWKAINGNADLAESDVPEILADENVRDPFMVVHFSQLQEIMVQGIEALPDKEKLLISLYYYEELTMKEIGQVMGYTESRISQLHTQAMLRLRASLRQYFKGDVKEPPISESLKEKINQLSGCPIFHGYLKNVHDCRFEPGILARRLEFSLSPREIEILWQYFPVNATTNVIASNLGWMPYKVLKRRRMAIQKVILNG